MKSAQPRIGRPTTEGIEGQKSTLSVRASAELKARLDAAAKERGRSLSQEAEVRLEQSFRDERSLIAAFELAYGRDLGGVLIAVGDAMRDVAGYKFQARQGATPAWVYDQMVQAAKHVLETLRSDGEIKASDPFTGPTGPSRSGKEYEAFRAWIVEIAAAEEQLGKSMAQRRLDRIADEKEPDAARELMSAALAARAKRK